MSENINKNTPACKLTEGGNIYTAGNAREFKTGDWRSMKPIFLSEKCKPSMDSRKVHTMWIMLPCLPRWCYTS